MPATFELKGSICNSSNNRVKIGAYSGAPVDLRDMGIEAPLVYDVNGIDYHNNVPYMKEHRVLIGHTIENHSNGKELTTVAEHSVDNNESKEIYNAIVEGTKYEASIRVTVLDKDVEYINSGTVSVNGRTLTSPLYIARHSTLTEVTATKSGRDSNTSIHSLSTNSEDNAMTVKKNFLDIKNSTPDEAPPVEAEAVEAPAPVAEATEATDAPAPSQEEALPLEVANSVPVPAAPVVSAPNDWMWDYLDHEVGRKLIKNARAEGWDKEKMDREIEIHDIQNSYPGVPGTHTSPGNAQYEARMALSLGISQDIVAKHCGEKATDYANSAGVMGLKESLMICANSNGGRFNGHSDVDALTKHVRSMVISNSFSTIDYPNLFHKVAAWKMEDIWGIDPPQAPSLCKTVNNKDFRETGHIKASGGKMWDSLDKDGKISHGTHGTEDKYTTVLNTIAQILVFKREDVINDDMGVIDDTLTLMLEGATMTPDYMFTRLFYGAEAAGVVEAGKSLFTLALDAANLTTVYNAVRRRYTDKKAPVNDKMVNGRFNTRWNLCVTPELEQTAWDLIKQDRIVQDDVKGAAGQVGDRNYWYNRFDIKVIDNLDNTTYDSRARADAWALLPEKESFRPFYIGYLGRQSRPVTESVDLPSDMLGFGVRGYWDMNLGYRPLEGDKLTAAALCIPTT